MQRLLRRAEAGEEAEITAEDLSPEDFEVSPPQRPPTCPPPCSPVPPTFPSFCAPPPPPTNLPPSSCLPIPFPFLRREALWLILSLWATPSSALSSLAPLPQRSQTRLNRGGDLQAFQQAVASGALSHLIERWEPWWESPAARGLRLTSRGEREGSPPRSPHLLSHPRAPGLERRC